MTYGNFANNTSARSIINSKVRSVSKPVNKYNLAVQRNAEDYLDEPLADYRDGSDTGIEPEHHD